MAEVVKAKERKSIVKIEEEKEEKEKKGKEKKPSPKKRKEEKKQSLWVRFRIFCHGVATEFKRVRWTTKKELLKYSIATIVFILFCSIFFYGIDTIFAFLQSLFK